MVLMKSILVFPILSLAVLSNEMSAAECRIAGQPTTAAVQLTKIIDGLDRPIKMIPVGKHLWIAEQAGSIRKVENGSLSASALLDIRDRVTEISRGGDERGLLGIAVHPKFVENRRVFVSYTTRPPLRSRISEFSFKSQTQNIDPASEKILLEVAQPFSNHNGGDINFGKDGMLYIAFGDGGSANDPEGNGQKLSSLLGKILRIDIDGASPYVIPKDNPFANSSNTRSEIFALGLRNPWRFSFDRQTGDLWTGDVGQNSYEEINLIQSGKNYGWNTMEGKHCFQGRPCQMADFAAPVHEYGRTDGYSVTGGYVYRGKLIPSLFGKYVFGDFGSGKVWALHLNNNAADKSEQLLATGRSIASFGEDSEGEIYLLDHAGSLHKITAANQRSESEFPFLLSQTNCFASLNPIETSPQVLPYEVNSPLWSDGAEKTRYIYLPSGKMISSQNGAWQFPEGAVLIKNFFIPRVENGTKKSDIVETRFLVKSAGQWQGYSYIWNDERTDAVVLNGSATRVYHIDDELGASESFTYTYPSQSDCNRCHTQGANRVLGFSQLQLNRDIMTPDGEEQNQLNWLASKNILDPNALKSPHSPRMPSYRDPEVSAELRARSFMHANCAHCHNPSTAAGQLPFDLRFETPLYRMAFCDQPAERASFGLPDPKLVDPGHADQSIALIRTSSTDPIVQMPPLGRARRDVTGMEVMTEWINQLTDCR
jgi:uncharacterized repeat protein (TIGR03806 family)